jgi:peptidoglycan hydrolase-like protein with peptidoglycan-binding domain
MRLFAWVAALALGGHMAAAQWLPPGGSYAAPPRGAIAELQWLLKGRGYDPGPVNGFLTGKTRRAIAAFEAAAGLPPDGIPGREVIRLLYSAAPHHETAAPSGGPGDPVVRAQQALARLGFLSGPPDGVAGPATRDAIIRFQVAHGLPIDPRVSDRLLAELRQASTPTAAPAAPSASEPAPAPPAPEGEGRQQLPTGVTPPPIR